MSARASSWLAALAVASAAGAQPSAPAPHDTALVALEERIAELDQRLRILARLRELEQDSLTALARTRAQVGAGGEGFVLRSADGDFLLRVRGYIQSDGRFFVADAPRAATPPPASAFVMRRVRPVFEASVHRYFGFRLMPDFGQGRTTLFDAHVDARVGHGGGATTPLAVRAGKFKPPVGLERLQSAADLRFAERGLPTNLVPNRDVGVQLSGDLLGGALAWAGGVFDGVPDLGNGDNDGGGEKDVEGRVFAQPFLRRGPRALRGLGVGIGGSRGRERGTVAAPALPAYLTPGQQPLFRYLAGTADSTTAVADGRRTRLAPHGWLHAGPLGLLGEWVASSQEVRRGARAARLTHHAWQLAGSWFLTGERATFGAVAPRRPLGAGPGGRGAVELKARYGELAVDPASFPTFASPATSPRRARAWAAGASWHLARGVKLVADYERTRFTGGEGAGDRAPERVVVTRLQTAF